MEADDGGRRSRQLAFLVEVDRLKSVLRRNTLADGSRRENAAEHSWHVVLAAALLAEHAAAAIDLGRVLLLLAIHDLVEVHAGDTFAYDARARAGKAERERVAARRLASSLPDDQGAWLLDLWEEFDAEETAEARFAAAIDRLQPVLLNDASGGVAWRRHGVCAEQVLERNRATASIAPALWERVEAIVRGAVARGDLVADAD